MTLTAVFVRDESFAGQDDQQLLLTVVPIEVGSATFPEDHGGESVFGFPKKPALHLCLPA